MTRGWIIVCLMCIACGRDHTIAPTSDAAPETPPDAGGDLVGCTGPLPVLRARDPATNEAVEPDWSCLEAAEPKRAAGPPREMTFLVATLLPALADDVTVDFFFGPSTVGTPAVTRVFAAGASSVTLEVPAERASLA